MMASLIGFLSGTVAWVLRASWQASLLALLVVAAQWILRGRLTARARCLLWGVVMLRLIAPPLPQARWTLFASLPQRHIAQAAVRKTNPVSIIPQRSEQPVISLPSAEMVPTLISRTVPGAARSARPKLAMLALMVWIIGVVLLGIRILLSSIRLVRSVRRCRPLNDPEVEFLVRDCAVTAGLRHAPPLLAAPHLSGPAITGFFSPRLLLPPELPANFSRAELRLMLLHEFAHLRRRDLQLSWLVSLLAAMHWFNPLLRWALDRLRADCELACDEFVLQLTSPAAPDGQRQTYGHALLRLAERLTQRPHFAAPTALGQIGILEAPRQLHRRIVMIAQFNPASRTFSRTWPVLVAGALLLCGGVLLADAADPSRPKTAVEPGNTVPTPAAVNTWKVNESAAATPRTEPAAPTAGDTFESLAVAGAQLRVRVAEVNLKSKKADFQRIKSIHGQAGVSDAEYEKASTELELAELNLQQEQVNLRIAQLAEKNKVAVPMVGGAAAASANPFEQARAKAAFLRSVNNMKQILIGIQMYAGDHDGKLPQTLREDLKPYLAGQVDALFTNPRAPQMNGTVKMKDDYVYVRPAEKLSDLKDTTTTILLYEAVDAPLDGDGVAVGYADGHVEKRQNLDELKTKAGGKKP